MPSSHSNSTADLKPEKRTTRGPPSLRVSTPITSPLGAFDSHLDIFWFPHVVTQRLHRMFSQYSYLLLLASPHLSHSHKDNAHPAEVTCLDVLLVGLDAERDMRTLLW